MFAGSYDVYTYVKTDGEFLPKVGKTQFQHTIKTSSEVVHHGLSKLDDEKQGLCLLPISRSVAQTFCKNLLSFFSFFFFFFLGLHLWHMEFPRLGAELELQLLAYATTTATMDPQHTERGQGSSPRPHGYLDLLTTEPRQQLQEFTF